MSNRNTMVAALAAIVYVTSVFSTADAARIPGLQTGPVELRSAGPIAFAGAGVLLAGDPKAATVYAIDIGDSPASAVEKLQIADLGAALGKALGVDPGAVSIADLAVNPETGNVVLSVTADGKAALVRIGADGSISPIDLGKIDHARKVLPNAPEDRITGEGRRARNLRDESITDIAFFDGKVIVSGVTSGASPAAVVEFPFPFAENTVVSNVEIYHAAHGRLEEPAIRTFVPFTIGGEPSLLAGFTCTPLVKFPIEQLRAGEKVRGTTVAELGNRNRPIDMFVYERDGKSYVLMNNTARGTMKISTQDIEANPGLTEPVRGGGTAGQPFETIEGWDSVRHMDKLDDGHAVIVREADGKLGLAVVGLP